METLEELKKEAKDLGIAFSANIGEAKLQEKIDAYYESQETSGKEILEAVEKHEKEQSEEKAVSTDKVLSKMEKVNQIKAEAMKTRVVTIIDNDQRVNNQTSSCTVNCSNMYFDLGQIILPLNMPVEVKQGHLNTLKELKIPQHVVGKDGLNTVVMRPRYTISYENVE